VSQALIKLQKVSFAYPHGRPVFQGIDLDLPPGRRVGLVGPNGSGKTTLLHLMVGLNRPSAGTIEAFGRVREKEADFVEVRAKAGLLFQDAEDQLFSPTVLEDVAFGPLNLGLSRTEARAVAERTLTALGLEGFGEKITYKLSGGQKRLVALASVLAMQPKALLLDEPAMGLDEGSVERVKEILGSLDLAMIVVSHRRDFLKGLVEETFCLDGGGLLPWDLEKPVTRIFHEPI